MKIILILVALVFLWWFYRIYSYKYFQKTMKIGDDCRFYENENRMFGIIKNISSNIVVIENAFGVYYIDKKEVYPK